MDNQHRIISGYRELTQEEIDLMNEIKEFGPQLEALIEKIETFNEYLEMGIVDKAQGSTTEEEIIARQQYVQFGEATPLRWTAIARTNLQQGLMALTRAVAKPTFF